MRAEQSCSAALCFPAYGPAHLYPRGGGACVEPGLSVRLSWTSQNATDIDLQPGVDKVEAQGSSCVRPPDSTRAQDSGRPADNSIKVHYSVDGGIFKPTELRATENGKTYQLIDKSKGMCLEVIGQRDFDGKGFADALVEHIVACGGNGAMNTLFFVSAFPGGRFGLSDEFAYSLDPPVIEEWKGRWSVLVTSRREGAGNTRLAESTERFILKSGKAVQVEERWRKEMESIAEIRSEMFDSDRLNETYPGVIVTEEPDGSRGLLLAIRPRRRRQEGSN